MSDFGIESEPVELSVVIPLYNAAGTIGLQLEALLQQQWPSGWEIVVADNGSTDNGREIVEGYAQRAPWVRVVDASLKSGPSNARNEGVAQARGGLIAFCDADDVVAPGWLAAMGSALRQYPAVTGPLELTELNAEWVQRVYGTKLAVESQSFAGVFPFGASANLGVRRSVFVEMAGFDPDTEVGEDIEFCLRLWASGHLLHFEADAIVHYRLRSTAPALWHQSVRYGAATPFIVKLLVECGHPVPGRCAGARKWLWLVKNLPALLTHHGRARWLVVLGGAAGRIVGSVRQRTLYL